MKTELPHSVERYCDAFKRAGFAIEPAEGPWLHFPEEILTKTAKLLQAHEGLRIGVAPFSRHALKTWPSENMVRLLQLISGKREARFWLFGGKEETKALEDLSNNLPHTENVAGRLSLSEELALMSRLDFMIAMDSANMHLAVMAGTRVVSLWGGTDPVNGFGAWKQPDQYTISISHDELTCRPCTVYGKGECKRGDFACMVWLTPEIVFARLQKAGLI